MDFKEMELLASENAPLPRGMGALDQAAYLSLRCLYCHYRNGSISKEDAEKEKRAIRSAHERRLQLDAFEKTCRQKSVTLWREVEGAADSYRKERTLEHADEMIRVIYGIGIPKRGGECVVER